LEGSSPYPTQVLLPHGRGPRLECTGQSEAAFRIERRAYRLGTGWQIARGDVRSGGPNLRGMNAPGLLRRPLPAFRPARFLSHFYHNQPNLDRTSRSASESGSYCNQLKTNGGSVSESNRPEPGKTRLTPVLKTGRFTGTHAPPRADTRTHPSRQKRGMGTPRRAVLSHAGSVPIRRSAGGCG
jgi:hypothetical protein